MATSGAYLLDTNILVHLIRRSIVGVAIESQFGLASSLNRCVISVVTVGEMYALAKKLNWGGTRQSNLAQLLGQVVWVDISHPDILAAYGDLDDVSSRSGRTMGKNDVWIAATAKVSGATLLTTDGDFDHLHVSHLNRIRIDSRSGQPLP
ncbi:tRNA(fMet)-specific endonuclease VapC [Caulifigura coniformis]|uniref:Ribonuclease VapC n=1 Tax=Caulifigura coniformis TaxID=2527983 RepID=A0A517S985_9PLAN|nr:type II toxin-antitoxin system VapC family toxin [Caulifigura coniformis]QDT52679.1 tRNA(fMet)-specific endonuclease VapC [Caulifigura coniformis]